MEINIPLLNGRWIYRVCTEYDLERLTREGWIYEKEIVEQDIESVADQVAVMVPSSGGGWVDTRTVTKYMPRRTVKYLLKRDESSELVKLIDENMRLKGLNEDHVRAIKKGCDELVGMKQKNDELINSAKYASERYDEQQERLEKTYSAKAKLEEDISKIRRAIGEKQMKEILEGK